MSVEHFKKEAKRLVKLAVQKAGGQHAVSGLTGVDTSQLSRWGNEDDDERHITLYRAMEIDEAAGDAIQRRHPDESQALASRCPCVAILTHRSPRSRQNGADVAPYVQSRQR